MSLTLVSVNFRGRKLSVFVRCINGKPDMSMINAICRNLG